MKVFRQCGRVAPLVVFFAMLAARPAHAVSKEMIELQTQVQQLIDSVARLQQSNDQQMGVLKDLVQQTVDSVNKMAVNVNGLQLKLQNQGDAQSTRNDQLSGQVQALNDSLDELKARMLRMEKSLSDIQNQAQTSGGSLGALPGASATPAGGPPSGPANVPAATPAPPLGPSGSAANGADRAPMSAAPAVGEMYRTAYSDYMAGKYTLASSEFNDLIKAYPDDNLAGNAYFYIGEMDVRGAKPAAAVKSYDQVLERYPDNAKIPAAHLHKGEALIAMKETDAGTRELRALVQRFPNSPEAAQARTRLNGVSARR